MAVATAIILTSCGGEETTTNNESNENTEEVVTDPCPTENDISVNFNAQSTGTDTSVFVNDGAFDVAQTSLVYFHDSTIVMKIDNYDGSREGAEDIELYVSLYTKNGEVLGEGDYSFDYQENKTANLLIYVGQGMLTCPTHLTKGSVNVTSYSKEKVCGSMDISMDDSGGRYGSIDVKGDFIVE